ncbi:MAG TPA: GNAT family N-acetyltransferase [Phnomibacter sp.]|nr:GNAT family N-acetyltransferase [Phnomibacter sp.]
MLEFNFSEFPVLRSQRLVLRQIQLSDTPAFFALRTNEQVMKYIGRPMAGSLDEARQLLQTNIDAFNNKEGISWAITEAGNDTLVGTIGFWRTEKEHYRTEIGYLLHPALHGKGLMQEAITLACNYAFTQTQLHSIEANVDPENIASRRVLEKCGFVQEAYFKESFFWNGEFLDSVIYSLVKPKAF